MPQRDEDDLPWGSRKMHLMVVLCQTIGLSTFIFMPYKALEFGATGHIIGYVLAYIFVGIPLLYMEFIVSQFTSRDCVEVWKLVPCLSHLGYVYIVWQIYIVICNHTVASFMFHYFLISFEDPIPFYRCGSWSNSDCDTMKTNYTIIQDCLKTRTVESDYCKILFTTFPEFQYWRYFILGKTTDNYYIAWQVCLASGFLCFVMYFSCFKRKKSIKWFVIVFTLTPVVGYLLLTLGSMTQKGLVTMYEDALDVNFQTFFERYRISGIIVAVVYALNIGTGLSFNLSSTNSFRAPCYSNIVITVVICAVLTTFAVCTNAMMPCPYAYEYNRSVAEVVNIPLSYLFENIPRMLKEYYYPQFWLQIIYSSNTVLCLSTNIIVTLSLFEMLADRYSLINRYPGLTCFLGSITLFVVSTPLLGTSGVITIYRVKLFVQLITVFLAVCECLVFVMLYGLERFAEDVHFMQGIRPKSYMKLAWMLSSIILMYVFINECIYLYGNMYWGEEELVGWWILFTVIVLLILVTMCRIIKMGIKKGFKECFKLESTWGPKNEVLLRSRAMFTAQAMTKEYMYRQYHLQAGIIARQATSNVRREGPKLPKPVP